MKEKKKNLQVWYASSLRELTTIFNDYNKTAEKPILREDIINILKDEDTGLYYLIYCK